MEQKVSTRSHFSLFSLKEALRLFLFLDKEQFKVLLTRNMAGQKTAPDWLQKLDLLTRFDAHADNARLTCSILGWLSASLTILCIIIDAILDNRQNIWWIIGKTGMFLTFVFFLLYFLLKKVDLENRLRYFVYPLIKILMQEIKPNTLIDLDLKLKPIQSRTYKTAVRHNKPVSKTHKFAKWATLVSSILLAAFFVLDKMGYAYSYEDLFVYIVSATIFSFALLFVTYLAQSYPIIITTIYTYPWLSFSARMADDTLLSVAFTDTLLHTSKTRTNARGKIKSKTKKIIKRRTALTIGFDKDNYAFREQARQSNKITGVKVVAKPNEKRHTFKIQQKQKLYSQFEPRLDAFLDLVGKAYQRMKQAS